MICRDRRPAATSPVLPLPTILTLALALAVVVAACGTGAASPAAPSPPATAPSPPATAIDTDALLGDASLDGRSVRVAGFFLATGDVASLCSVVLESYPPQCGGGTVRITGEVPADVIAALDRTNDPALAQATWGWVEVTGTLRAAGPSGAPTIELASIRVVAPGG